MAVEDAAQAEILHGVLHRRVGLQLDALLQAVDVDPGHAGHLVALAGLLVDDRSQRHHLQPAQSAALAFCIAFGSPETVVLALHALDELPGRHRPVELVTVGNEHRKERHAVESDLRGQLLRGQRLHDRRGIGVDLPCEFLRQLGRDAHVVDRHPHGGLQPQLEHARDFDDAHAVFEHVMPGLEGFGQVDPPGIGVESPAVFDLRQQRVRDLPVFGPGAHVEVPLRNDRISIELLPQDKPCAGRQDERRQQAPT